MGFLVLTTAAIFVSRARNRSAQPPRQSQIGNAAALSRRSASNAAGPQRADAPLAEPRLAPPQLAGTAMAAAPLRMGRIPPRQIGPPAQRAKTHQRVALRRHHIVRVSAEQLQVRRVVVALVAVNVVDVLVAAEPAPQEDAHHQPVNRDHAPPHPQRRVPGPPSSELSASLQQAPYPGHSLLEARRCGGR